MAVIDGDLDYFWLFFLGLDRAAKLMALGSRNFFLCAKRWVMDGGIVDENSSCSGGITTTSSPSCSKEVETVSKSGFPWLKFMDFLR